MEQFVEVNKLIEYSKGGKHQVVDYFLPNIEKYCNFGKK